MVFDLGAELTAFGEYFDTKSFEKGLFVDAYFLAEGFNCLSELSYLTDFSVVLELSE
jgi:hypothetical protein